MAFQHRTIDRDPPCGRLGICLPTDLTGNGRPDVIVGGMGTNGTIRVGGRKIDLRGLPGIGDIIRRRETSLFWYENPGWERHAISETPDLYVFGNAVGDLTGDGRDDLVVGQGIHARGLFWFEQPADPREPWDEYLFDDRFEKYHDIAIADVDDDGENEVVGLSQESEVVFYYDVPENPRLTPWPEECLTVVAKDLDVEGLEIVDIDGDGSTELVAGPYIFHRTDDAGEEWDRETIVSGWDWTRVAVDDLDGDGELEVVLAEGDAPLLGEHPGRVAWFDPPDWEQHTLRDDLFCPHTLQIADFDGNGRPDIYVAEMAHGQNDEPQHLRFVNQGDGSFEERPIGYGVETHEAKAVDLTGGGRPDIVGKSYTPDHHVDAWYNNL